ncbi:MAG: hypothetical protein M0R77_01080 [Gammaproteobacteria bacterium]|nr:hypothetical protein [Acholeplasmataceae bacterium]MCK9529149.1 hypothetical protein [Gammaproteobacteria bacterium]
MKANLAFSLIGAAAVGLSNLIAAAAKPQSLMKRAAIARLEPNAIIDERCLLYPNLNDVLSVTTNVFIATYLQLISLSRTTSDGTQIIKRVSLQDTRLGGESYLSSMLSIEAAEQPNVIGILDEITEFKDIHEDALPAEDYYSQESQVNRKLIEGLNDSGSLAVGRFIEVEIEKGADGKPVTVEIAVRMMSTIANTNILKNALESRFKGNEGPLERKHGWKTGRLSFISDLVFGSDLIRKHRNLQMKDVDGIYSKLSPNKMRGKTGWDVVTGKFSIAEASSVLVLDQETVDEVEYAMGGKFSNKTFRDRLLEATGVMTLAIIDRGDDMVTFYYDSIADGTRLNSAALRSAGKKDGPDVGKILEQFIAQGQVRF